MDTLDAQRAKLNQMFDFWGWDVRPDDVRLEWHIDAELSLAVWCIWRRTDAGMVRAWAITEPSGVLPVDQLPADGIANPRSALRAFGERWQVVATDRLEDRLDPGRVAELRRSNPAIFQQAEHMREMIGVASQLLLAMADEDEADD